MEPARDQEMHKGKSVQCSGDGHLALWLRVMDQTRAGHKPTGDNTILPRHIDAGVNVARQSAAYHELGMVPLRVQLAERTLSWAARLINVPGDRLPRLVMFSQLVEGQRNCSRLTF